MPENSVGFLAMLGDGGGGAQSSLELVDFPHQLREAAKGKSVRSSFKVEGEIFSFLGGRSILHHRASSCFRTLVSGCRLLSKGPPNQRGLACAPERQLCSFSQTPSYCNNNPGYGLLFRQKPYVKKINSVSSKCFVMAIFKFLSLFYNFGQTPKGAQALMSCPAENRTQMVSILIFISFFLTIRRNFFIY